MDLDGAIDLHVHSAPDVYDRSVDDIELVREATAAGMAGVVLKSHHTLTADRATLARRETAMPIFGGITLNQTVGGLNAVAVEMAIQFGARQVWMPTIHAEHCLATSDAGFIQAEVRKGRQGISILDQDGNLKEILWPILEQIRDADIALGTGHIAPAESLVLLREAKNMGIHRLLVTHPLMSFTRFTLDQMREAVAYGGLLEFDYLSCSPNWHKPVDPARTAAAMTEIGAAHCVMSTDGGQSYNPHPAKMLDEFARQMHDHNITMADLRTMMCDNTAHVVGLR